jgi:hypothetical protein
VTVVCPPSTKPCFDSKHNTAVCDPIATGAIADYLEVEGHSDEKTAPLFRPVSNNAQQDVFGYVERLRAVPLNHVSGTDHSLNQKPCRHNESTPYS